MEGFGSAYPKLWSCVLRPTVLSSSRSHFDACSAALTENLAVISTTTSVQIPDMIIYSRGILECVVTLLAIVKT